MTTLQLAFSIADLLLPFFSRVKNSLPAIPIYIMPESFINCSRSRTCGRWLEQMSLSTLASGIWLLAEPWLLLICDGSYGQGSAGCASDPWTLIILKFLRLLTGIQCRFLDVSTLDFLRLQSQTLHLRYKIFSSPVSSSRKIYTNRSSFNSKPRITRSWVLLFCEGPTIQRADVQSPSLLGSM